MRFPDLRRAFEQAGGFLVVFRDTTAILIQVADVDQPSCVSHQLPVQSSNDLGAVALDCLAHDGRINVEVTMGPPINVLAPSDRRKHWITAPPRLAFERRNSDVKDWENKIGSFERPFTCKKRLEFEITIFAVYRARCDDRDEEYRLLHR